jgi:hypothetical protein
MQESALLGLHATVREHVRTFAHSVLARESFTYGNPNCESNRWILTLSQLTCMCSASYWCQRR